MEPGFAIKLSFGVPTRVDYTNWKGERRERHIRPVSLWYGVSPYHPGPQWIVAAEDLEDGGRVKDFALSGFLSEKGRGLMVYHVMNMIPFGGVVRYQHCVTCQDLATAVRTADLWNKSIQYTGRYFVVSQKEYEDLWKRGA